MLTYGDGLADIDITKLIKFHRSHGKLATVTAVVPPARYGALQISDGKVLAFSEKPMSMEPFINGGFFVLSPEVINLISNDGTPWEGSPQQLVGMGELRAFKHAGFWQSMDTLRDLHC